MSKTIKMPKAKVVKVAVCIPSGPMVHTDFALSLSFLAVKSIRCGIHLCIVNYQSALVEVSRNELIESARKLDADKVLFLDSDMTFPDTLLVDLLATNKDIVCCDALRKCPPFKTVVNDAEGNEIDHENCEFDLVELMGASTAAMLVDMKVFDRIDRPYFHVAWKDDNTFQGEDYYFSDKVRTKGFKIWCDVKSSKNIGHIGAYTFFVRPKKPKS